MHLFFPFWLLLDAPAFAAPEAKPISLLIAPQRKNLVVDGDFSDWGAANFTSVTPQNGVFDSEASSTSDAADLSFRFALCHDGKALYVAVEVTDDAIVVDSTDPEVLRKRPGMTTQLKFFSTATSIAQAMRAIKESPRQAAGYFN